MAIYERHRPEESVLYQSVVRGRPWVQSTVTLDYALADESIAPHIVSEFERYERCGILEHGFVRLFCKVCDAERVVSFSCKGRGFCPSCGARRALQKAHRLSASS